jgi:plasmid stabilization system protein ParE
VNFTLVLLPKAMADIRSALRWIAGNVSKASAIRWNSSMDAAIRKVLANPHAHRRAHEADDLGIDLREALFGRRPHIYRLLFTIHGTDIRIHFVRHAARDWLTETDL